MTKLLKTINWKLALLSLGTAIGIFAVIATEAHPGLAQSSRSVDGVIRCYSAGTLIYEATIRDEPVVCPQNNVITVGHANSEGVYSRLITTADCVVTYNFR
jgi:hypothetical protein